MKKPSSETAPGAGAKRQITAQLKVKFRKLTEMQAGRRRDAA